MRIVFMGTGEIGLPTLRAMISRPDLEVVAVVTQPDRPAGRGRQLKAPEIKIAAEEAGIPVLQPQKLRDPAAVEAVRVLAPDVIVVMAYGQILSRAVLDLPRLACLNLHASLLPRHRGAAPIQSVIAEGDAETGIAVMYMAEGLDTGDVLLMHRTPIRPDETGGSLHDRLAELAPGALLEALDLLREGNAPRLPQDNALATYAGRLSREDGRIDWSRSAVEIERRIRAMNPWPAALTALPLVEGGSARLKVFRASVVEEGGGRPGVLLSADASGIVISTGAGAVRLLEVQGEGGRRMSAGQWLSGHAVVLEAIAG